ncbi:radical SAM protein [Nitrospina gracilis]|uniref:radical SAM protein n=1 Tax=Nitrospina gracilis TaxID=35801 RepID=UPI001F0182DB|nr:radical SAM protein [Nitrospina gracilis]MCF8721402.1 uncharacterized protein [Nitrospina gracilis Nb-211]
MIIFKIHSRCNLDCSYCYMYRHHDDSYLRKPKQVPWPVVEQVAEMIDSHCRSHDLHQFTISLHGGEPLLVGKEYLDRMLCFFRAQISDVQLKFSLQTNAVLVDEEWIEIFNKHDVAVCASIDGPEQANVLRLTHDGQSSWQQTVNGIRQLQEGCEQFAGVLTVVNPAADGRRVVSFLINELKARWFDLLLPDYSHDSIPENFQKIQAGLRNFMIGAFDEWFLYALEDGVQCRLFDNLLARLMGESSHIDTIGHDGASAINVETDGTLEPHDALRVCQGFDRTTGIVAGAGALDRIGQSDSYVTALQKTREIPDKCRTCFEFDICKGGHVIHRWSRSKGFANPSVHCDVLYGLIRHVQTRLGGMLLSQDAQTVCQGLTITPHPRPS